MPLTHAQLTCRRKVPYRHKKSALSALAGLKKHIRMGYAQPHGGTLAVYRCGVCLQWHVGNRK